MGAGSGADRRTLRCGGQSASECHSDLIHGTSNGDMPQPLVSATAMIGLLLVVIAAVLAVEMKSLLVGESAGREHQAAIQP